MRPTQTKMRIVIGNTIRTGPVKKSTLEPTGKAVIGIGPRVGVGDGVGVGDIVGVGEGVGDGDGVGLNN